MQNAFAFGIAKNVNGLPAARRAASAYQIGGPMSSPTAGPSPGASFGTSAGDSSTAGHPGEAPGPIEHAARAGGLPRVASSPMAFSLSTDVSDWAIRSPATTRGRYAVEDNHAVHKSQGEKDVTLSVSNVQDAATTSEVHLSKRGSTVDKTNPFIGYFQTGQEETDDGSIPEQRKVVRVQSGIPSTGKGASSYYPSVLLAPQKRFTEWLGAQSSRFPPFFKRNDQRSENGGTPKATLLSEAGFLPSLQLTPLKEEEDSTKSNSEKQKSQDSAISRFQSLPTAIASPVTSTALQSESVGLVSRFEQDFDVLGSLGEGGQGAVYKVRSKVDGCQYAIKKVSLPNSMQRGSVELDQALREVRSMATMPPHANVVRYHTAWIEEYRSADDSTSSTLSVRGSDVGSAGESASDSCGPSIASLQRQLEKESSVAVSENEPSFSLDFSSNSISFDQYSSPGFQFTEASESCVTFEREEDAFSQPSSLDGGKQAKPRASPLREPKVKTPGLNLYIQMELCGSVPTSGIDATAEADRSFNRLLDSLTLKQQDKTVATPATVSTPAKDENHSNLTAWLRGSYDQRARWSAQSSTHLDGLKLFLGVAQGVAHMHSCGVIHRDLKPDNIFIHGDVAKIGDFGLSKSIFSDSTRSRNAASVKPGDEYGDHTTALGTFTYASPEQLGYRFSDPVSNLTPANRVKSAKYSIKSDIFALGVILLEMCCPFSTMMERSQVLTGVRHGVVPQRALQHFPAEMTLVLRMTAIDPAERPTSEEVCDSIRRLLAASGVATARTALDDLRDLQSRMAVAVRQLRDRSQTTLQLEMLISELNDKVQSVGVALA